MRGSLTWLAARLQEVQGFGVAAANRKARTGRREHAGVNQAGMHIRTVLQAGLHNDRRARPAK